VLQKPPSEESHSAMEELCVCWASNGLPYKLVDDPLFRKIFKSCYPRGGVNRHTLPIHMVALMGKYQREFASLVRGKAVTVALDGWKNRDAHIMNFAAISDGVAYYIDSVEYEHCDAATVCKMLRETKLTLGGYGATMAAVSADNLASMVAGVEAFLGEPGNECVVRVKCAAHSTQLLCKDICKLPPVSLVVGGVLGRYLAHFDNTDNRKKLRDYQLADGKLSPLKVKRPGETRWDSKVAALQRMVELRKYIGMVDLEITGPTWGAIEFAIDVLAAIKLKTNVLQSDRSTVRDASVAWEELHVFMEGKASEAAARIAVGEQGGARQVLVDFYENCSALVRARRDKHAPNAPVAKVAVLLLGCDGPNEAPEDSTDMADALAKAATYYHVSWGAPEAEAEKKASVAVRQFADFILGGGDWRKNEGESWREYWSRQAFKRRELSTVALAMGSIHPTEACVERTFSHQGIAHNDLRNRLSDESVKAIMTVRFNHGPLYKVARGETAGQQAAAAGDTVVADDGCVALEAEDAE
jgi:hypothetical protein